MLMPLLKLLLPEMLLHLLNALLLVLPMMLLHLLNALLLVLPVMLLHLWWMLLTLMVNCYCCPQNYYPNLLQNRLTQRKGFPQIIYPLLLYPQPYLRWQLLLSPKMHHLYDLLYS